MGGMMGGGGMPTPTPEQMEALQKQMGGKMPNMPGMPGGFPGLGGPKLPGLGGGGFNPVREEEMSASISPSFRGAVGEPGTGARPLIPLAPSTPVPGSRCASPGMTT